MVVYNDELCTKQGIVNAMVEVIDGVEEVIDVSADNKNLKRLVEESVRVGAKPRIKLTLDAPPGFGKTVLLRKIRGFLEILTYEIEVDEDHHTIWITPKAVI